MYLLDKNQYNKALEPLLNVNVNHLFARFVVEKHVSGMVYADDPLNPSAFHVVHPYGMSLLYGTTGNSDFHKTITAYMLNRNSERSKTEWMQVFPDKWNDRFRQWIGDSLVPPDCSKGQMKIEVHKRANFRFNREKYRLLMQDIPSGRHPVIRMDRELYHKMEGVVVPLNFWNNADDFLKKGVGFTMVIDGKPACTAYSAFIFDGILELGIETVESFRGKGYALNTCKVLIDFCLENGYEPVWSCRFENTASYQLAQKLGFEPTLTLPYYKLP